MSPLVFGIIVVCFSALALGLGLYYEREHKTEYVAMLFAPATANHNQTWPLTAPGLASLKAAGVKIATAGEVVSNYRANKPNVPENQIGKFYGSTVCNPANREQYACAVVGYNSSATSVASAKVSNDTFVNKTWSPVWLDATAYGNKHYTGRSQCGLAIWVKGTKSAILSTAADKSFKWTVSPIGRSF